MDAIPTVIVIQLLIYGGIIICTFIDISTILCHLYIIILYYSNIY